MGEENKEGKKVLFTPKLGDQETKRLKKEIKKIKRESVFKLNENEKKVEAFQLLFVFSRKKS